MKISSNWSERNFTPGAIFCKRSIPARLGKAKPGDSVKVPNVAAPFDVQEAIDLKKQTDEAEKTNTLKTEDKKPQEEQFALFVSVADKMMEVKQNGKLVGSYPITPGSKSLPAPIGEWFVRGFAWMPTFRWDEAMLHHDERSKDFFNLPPGPNNPVGILWMELNHKGSGIHGTEVPRRSAAPPVTAASGSRIGTRSISGRKCSPGSTSRFVRQAEADVLPPLVKTQLKRVADPKLSGRNPTKGNEWQRIQAKDIAKARSPTAPR